MYLFLKKLKFIFICDKTFEQKCTLYLYACIRINLKVPSIQNNKENQLSSIWINFMLTFIFFPLLHHRLSKAMQVQS